MSLQGLLAQPTQSWQCLCRQSCHHHCDPLLGSKSYTDTAVLRAHEPHRSVKFNILCTPKHLSPASHCTCAWRANQWHEIAQLKASDKPIILGGDGRTDSPGHSAKYGSYTCMDINSGKIVDLQLVQVN